MDAPLFRVRWRNTSENLRHIVNQARRLAVATYCDLHFCTPKSRFGYIARTLGNALSASIIDRFVSTFGESLTREMRLARDW